MRQSASSARHVPTATHRGLAVAALLSAGLLHGCGGGGSSGSAATPIAQRPPPAQQPAPAPQPVGFESGTFAPFSTFENLCQAPRSGFDPSGRPWPDVAGTFVDENDFLRSWSNDRYLWFDEIADVDPASLATPDYFDRMKTFATTASGAPKDRFHFTQDTDAFLAFQQSGVQGGYGAELAVLESRPPREVRVAFTQAGSPAALAGIARGAEIVSADGVDVRTGSDVDTINRALFGPAPGESHVLGIVDRGSASVREVTLTAAEIVSEPVQNVRVIATATGPVGYLAFHDHIATAEGALFDAFTSLRNAGVVDLVLDMRYNGGGLLAIAGELGTMVAGSAATSGRVFDELRFNSKHQVVNPFTGQRLAPDTFPTTTLGFSRPSGIALPGLDLARVFVLTGPGTCSASESVINGLRGIGVEVVQIGERTCGKPFGFYPEDNCGTTYFSVHFQSLNAQGWGDFGDGFLAGESAGPAGVVPGCVVADDFGNDLGDPNEGRLAAALAFRADGTCPVGGLATSPAARFGIAIGEGPAIGPPAWREGAWMLP